MLLGCKVETFKHSLLNNRNGLTKEMTSMNEETIVGVRRVKENVHINKGPENIIITNSMIWSAQNVDEVYKRHLDKKSKRKNNSFKLRKKYRSRKNESLEKRKKKKEERKTSRKKFMVQEKESDLCKEAFKGRWVMEF